MWTRRQDQTRRDVAAAVVTHGSFWKPPHGGSAAIVWPHGSPREDYAVSVSPPLCCCHAEMLLEDLDTSVDIRKLVSQGVCPSDLEVAVINKYLMIKPFLQSGEPHNPNSCLPLLPCLHLSRVLM